MDLDRAERLAAFLNTFDSRRPDRREPPFAPGDTLDSSGALAAWLAEAGLVAGTPQASADDLERAHRLRAGLRRLLVDAGDTAARRDLNALTGSLPLVVEIDGTGQPLLRAAHHGVRGAMAQLLADAVRLVGDGEWSRLKTCASADCRWVFIDRSRPRTGRWCSSAACGNREKTRRHRARLRGGGT